MESRRSSHNTCLGQEKKAFKNDCVERSEALVTHISENTNVATSAEIINRTPELSKVIQPVINCISGDTSLMVGCKYTTVTRLCSFDINRCI